MSVNEITIRFIDLYKILKKNRKLPTNKVLADQLDYGTGNSITEITKGRQNIKIEALQKFCKIYGPENGFSIEYFIRSEVNQQK
ncbi:hypothetical protein [Chitinophaga silvisoli]|uniref:XRE family transcriptional regulator n=1 Tax=Chitinophaga silvisoli TaxID=2291814 RepID=A0A3E1NXW2_9BACT|nr:hypothetical protein [Chitinophaga silvisoli]RFM32588.1 hypothetical protein DXN04_23205 [Chitinophaga silvisoli]